MTRFLINTRILYKFSERLNNRYFNYELQRINIFLIFSILKKSPSSIWLTFKYSKNWKYAVLLLRWRLNTVWWGNTYQMSNISILDHLGSCVNAACIKWRESSVILYDRVTGFYLFENFRFFRCSRTFVVVVASLYMISISLVYS